MTHYTTGEAVPVSLGQHSGQGATTTLADGGYVIAWRSDDDVAEHFQVFNASGAARSAIVDFGGLYGGGRIDVAALAGGGFVAIWNDRDERLHFQRFDAFGAAVGAESLIKLILAFLENVAKAPKA